MKNLRKVLIKLSELDIHSHRVNLIREHFLGTRKHRGSARICIPLNDKWVLKVAKNEKGIKQNLFEAECYKRCPDYYKRYFAKVKDYCRGGNWLIQQRIKPLSMKQGMLIKEDFLKIKLLRNIIQYFDIDIRDLDQIGIVKKQFKIYDYGLSSQIFRQYYL